MALRPAIPFEILLFEHDVEANLIPGKELLRLLKAAFPEVEIDPERGRREVLQRMQDMLDLGTPEIMVQGYPVLAEQTCHVTVRWSAWPNQCVTGHVSDGELRLNSQHQNFEFIRYAAGQLAAAFQMQVILQTPFNKAVETESSPRRLEPREWIKARYAEMDDSHFIEDPAAGECLPAPRRHPVLREISDWPASLQRGVRHYLEEYPRRNSEAMTQGFETFDDYATAYVEEIAEFAPVRNCWSIHVDQSHHNRVVIDHGDWLTLINLDGVPTQLFEA